MNVKNNQGAICAVIEDGVCEWRWGFVEIKSFCNTWEEFNEMDEDERFEGNMPGAYLEGFEGDKDAWEVYVDKFVKEGNVLEVKHHCSGGTGYDNGVLDDEWWASGAGNTIYTRRNGVLIEEDV